MAEEHGFQAPEGHRFFSNNCGYFGSLATTTLCSKCYRDLRMKEEQGALAKAALEANNGAKSSSTSLCVIVAEVQFPESTSVAVERLDPAAPAGSVKAVAQPNRCVSCRKRVGLTGFRCRCGSKYCGLHRYPEQHGCTFDYKAAGKEAIAKANPVVKDRKLNKI